MSDAVSLFCWIVVPLCLFLVGQSKGAGVSPASCPPFLVFAALVIQFSGRFATYYWLYDVPSLTSPTNTQNITTALPVVCCVLRGPSGGVSHNISGFPLPSSHPSLTGAMPVPTRGLRHSNFGESVCRSDGCFRRCSLSFCSKTPYFSFGAGRNSSPVVPPI